MQGLLDGKQLAKIYETDLASRVEKLPEPPCLATIIVGDDPASHTYVKMKSKACERIGAMSKTLIFDKTFTTEELITVIEQLNQDKSITGILIQHPLPEHIDERACFNAIDLKKDVDGVHTDNFGLMAHKMPSTISCTPLGIMTLLSHYHINLEGLNVVIVGRSHILGLPLSMLMINANANVTVCHSKTSTYDLEKYLKNADVIVGACGIPHFIKPEHISKGVVLIDAGYKDGKGDIDPACYDKAEYFTPVPGGVGPMTIAMLLLQTVEAKERSL